MNQEVWKFYRNEPHCAKIEVSNEGNVKVNNVLVDFTKQADKPYYRICKKPVHRMVAELFVPNPYNKPIVDHIDTNKHNNKADNLRWVTNKENMNNPLTREHISNVMKDYYRIYGTHSYKMPERTKKKFSEENKLRRHMSNGVSSVFVKPEQFDYYRNLGYHFGRK